MINRNDGVFYTSLKDFKKYFESIDFLYFRDSYDYKSSVIRPKTRLHRTEKYQYSNVRLALG